MNVTVNNTDASTTVDSLYSYAADKTAVVSGVSPSRGGTGGGTVVTISGMNFG